jgi:hypothetical protein
MNAFLKNWVFRQARYILFLRLSQEKVQIWFVSLNLNPAQPNTKSQGDEPWLLLCPAM